jgi:predicted AAA+ superfamily ATPase
VTRVQPSAIREGFATVPGVTWDDVGALDEVREELSFAISQPIANPERFLAMGLNIAVGVLLYGPPGCGKTLVAKAVANDAHANFISIKVTLRLSYPLFHVILKLHVIQNRLFNADKFIETSNNIRLRVLSKSREIGETTGASCP